MATTARTTNVDANAIGKVEVSSESSELLSGFTSSSGSSGFSVVTSGFSVVTSGFSIVILGFSVVTSSFSVVTSSFSVVTLVVTGSVVTSGPSPAKMVSFTKHNRFPRTVEL